MLPDDVSVVSDLTSVQKRVIANEDDAWAAESAAVQAQHVMARRAVKAVTSSYGVIRSRLAKSVVEQLFLVLGLEAYRTGVEVTQARLKALAQGGKATREILAKVEQQPDFMVVAGADVVHVEVKYRKNGRIRLNSLKNYHDPALWFVFVDDCAMYCIRNDAVKALRDRKQLELHFAACLRLQDCPVFAFSRQDKRAMTAYCEFLPTFLNNTGHKQKALDAIETRYTTLLCAPDLAGAFARAARDDRDDEQYERQCA